MWGLGSLLRLARPCLALGVLVPAACMPGARVEVYNRSGEPVEIIEVKNDASTRAYVLDPGGSQTFGPAVTWHVASAAGRYELTHPGEGFSSRGGFGPGEVHRFQIEEGGCVFVLPPEATPPVARPPAQPAGYPLGPPACRGSG